MVTRSPSRLAQGVTDTSGSQSRSFEAGSHSHQTSTAPKATKKPTSVRRRRGSRTNATMVASTNVIARTAPVREPPRDE